MVSRYWESSIVLELFKLYDLTLAGALLSSSPDNRRNTYHITSLMISNLRADNLRPNSLLTSWLIFLLVFGGGRLRVVKSVVNDLRERMAAWNPGDETHFAPGISRGHCFLAVFSCWVTQDGLSERGTNSKSTGEETSLGGDNRRQR